MIHLSTDYVFDGRAKLPYPERAPTSPLSIYGASKLSGEKALRSSGAHYVIVRTQSLFGVHGPNFVKTISKKLLESTEPLRVVDDQIMSPTFTGHLAEALVLLVNKSGPSDQWSRLPSPEKWIQSPACSLTRVTGSPLPLGPTETGVPV